MNIQTLEFHSVDYHYPEQSISLFTNLQLSFASGWSAVIGSNGSGKSTILQLATGLLKPHSGNIVGPEACVYVAQRPDQIPDTYSDFAYSYDALACKLHGLLDLDRDIISRWETMSYGECKRAQIGWALYQESDVLCIDEPTNHLDGEAIQLLKNALSLYKGIGILVSHDLDLLDLLCSRTIIVHAPLVTIRSCPPSQAMDELSKETVGLVASYQQQSKRNKRLNSEKQQRAQKASIQDSLNSKRNVGKKDHDQKARIDAVRVSGSDGKAGRLSKQLDMRLQKNQTATHFLQAQITQYQGMNLNKESAGVTFDGSIHAGKTLVRQEGEIELPLGPERSLLIPPCILNNSDRLGIQGPNGSGKSTFLRYLFSVLSTGSVRWWAMDQELSVQQSLDAFKRFKEMKPDIKGRMVSSLVRLGSDPNLFLSSALPSPGEMRKLLIAEALEESYELLVLDEPTNHLDLPSRLALENTLGSYSGALVIVSHDLHFLNTVCSRFFHTTWLNENHDSILQELVD